MMCVRAGGARRHTSHMSHMRNQHTTHAEAAHLNMGAAQPAPAPSLAAHSSIAWRLDTRLACEFLFYCLRETFEVVLKSALVQ